MDLTVLKEGGESVQVLRVWAMYLLAVDTFVFDVPTLVSVCAPQALRRSHLSGDTGH